VVASGTIYGSGAGGCVAISLSRWRARHLLAAWTVYWVALIAFGAHSALSAVASALNAPKGLGSISASVENGLFVLKVSSEHGAWRGTTSLTAMALWFAGPPLLLFLLWLVTRSSPADVREPERDYRTY